MNHQKTHLDPLAPRRLELMARYERLRSPLKVLFQLCALLQGRTHPNNVHFCLKAWENPPHGLQALSLPQVQRLLGQLQGLHLLDASYRCDPAIVEIVARRAAADADFAAMSQAILQLLPREVFYNFGDRIPPFAWLGQSNLRLLLYRRDLDQALRCYQQLKDAQAALPCPDDPLVEICNNPFDPEWFSGYPVDFQCIVLREILQAGIHLFRPDAAALDYALQIDAAEPSDASPLRLSLRLSLATRLLLAGRLDEVLKLALVAEKSRHSFGVLPILEYLRGNHAAALALFNHELAELAAQHRRKPSFFPDWAGIFFLLTLLQSNDEAGLAQAEAICLSKRSAREVDAALLPLYRSLTAIVKILRYDLESARALLDEDFEKDAGYRPDQGKMNFFFHAVARYWLDGALQRPMIDELSKMFREARTIGLNWAAMELAELLCRVEQETPLRRKAVEQFVAATGAKSLVASIRIEEPWRRILRSLVNYARNPRSDPARVNDKRLAWFVRFDDGQLSLHPREQTRRADGDWTPGRVIGLKRFSEAKMEYLTGQDHRLRAALRRTGDSWGPEHYEFDPDQALPALVGHPLVFLDEAPTVPVEILRGEPEILVTREDRHLRIALAGELPKGRVLLVRETPTRFKVIEFNDQQLKIAELLGGDGVQAPIEARDEVLEAVSNLSAQVLVHSAVGGVGGDIVEVTADPTPHAHLLPAGTGFTLGLFVRPFGTGGPYLKAGSGAATVIAEIGGERRQARRDLAEEQRRILAVEAACPLLRELPETDKQWLVREPEDCLHLLSDLKGLQDRGEIVVFWPEGEKLRVSRPLSFDHLHLRVNSKNDWFELNGELRVDDDLVVDMKQLLELTAASPGRFVQLAEGQFLVLTEQLRKRLGELEAFAQRRGKALQFHPLAALTVEDLAAELPHFTTDSQWRRRLEAIHQGLAATPEVPSTFTAELRDYQLTGYIWLMRLAQLGFGACLADDMGLGKTIQALAVLVARSSLGPALVVAPTSVCMNWHTEAARFAPTLRVVQLAGNDRARLVAGLGPRDLLVTSYALLHQEAERLGTIPWSTIVLDEAQAIKNVATKRAQAAMNLQGAFRMITTGTPLENHLGEFWSLFHFINPGLLGSLKKFTARFAVPIEKHQDREARRRLKKLVQPFILRRTKSQVLEELPERTEVTLQVEMQEAEAAFYEALRRQALERLARLDGPFEQQQVKILAEITRLRRAACNPRLISPQAEIPSAKLELFLEVVDELLENRHKILVFSQFVGHLKLLRQALDRKGILYRYLDGSTPVKVRRQEVDAFQAGQGDLFLISLKAGGFGLNLTAADYVIHMDPWWNPAVEDQASDRAHRIGQNRPVTIYRLVVSNTIEEKIVRLHAEKRDLAGSLLAGSDVSGRVSAEELLQLIRG